MNGNKKPPCVGAQGGAEKPRKGNEMNSYILHAKRAIVKGLVVLVGLWCLSALSALNVPALVGGVLALNALLGAWFALDEEVAT